MEQASRTELSTILTKTQSVTQKALGSSPTNEPACKDCNDTTFVSAGKGRVRRCGCVIEKAIAVALPPKYQQARLADFPRVLQDQMVEWLTVPTAGLFITGPTGCGKTHLAAAIVRTRFEVGKKASFRRAADLYCQVRASYGATDDLSESAILAGYRGSPLLVLDDLASGSLSDHERRIALEVIDSRGNDCLPTVVTSNWTIEDIAKKMDERIASRLKDYRPIAFRGADRRKAK